MSAQERETDEVLVDALQAAAATAKRFGLTVQRPVVLAQTNNIVLWLRPAPVVAKVAVGHYRRMHDELEVATALMTVGAPVVGPAPEFFVTVHRHGDFEITFWRYHPQPHEPPASSKAVAVALRALHASFNCLPSTLTERLPSFTDELDAVRTVLRDGARMPALNDEDRVRLLKTHDRLRTKWEGIASVRGAYGMIHGSPHRLKIVLVSGEPRFIDFETACVGRVEWDLAHLEPDVSHYYGRPLDDRALWICRGLVSIKTAAWCWRDVERGDLRSYAEFHLARVKEQFVE